jgi:hypothetical protein
VLYCVINIRDGAARFARAGHPAPLHVRRTAAYWIPAFWVPALLVTHYVTFIILTKHWKGNVDDRPNAA